MISLKLTVEYLNTQFRGNILVTVVRASFSLVTVPTTVFLISGAVWVWHTLILPVDVF
jgi:hypothetical protein